MEKAFKGPKVVQERLGHVDPVRIAEMDADEFVVVASKPPAIHRFPGSMAKRVQELCRYVVEEFDGDVRGIWNDGDGAVVLARLKGLPGFGEQKARIFLALLGKQMGVEPEGWREAAGAYGEVGARRSVADVVDAVSLGEVREFKKAAKAAAKKT